MLESEIKILRDISDAKKGRGIEDITYVKPDAVVKEVVQLINEKGFSHIPVMKGRKAIGCITENRLMKKLLDNPDLVKSAVEDVIEECCPTHSMQKQSFPR